MMQPSKSQYDFDKIADNYDSWYDSAIGAMYDKLEKQTIDKLLADIAGHGRLLEIGCGTGHWSWYFSDKGFEVTGVDMSEKMIDVARQKNMPNSHFEVADGRNLPFEDAGFDAAAAITVLEFSPEPERIIAEMIRCVRKKNGVLIIAVLNALNAYNQTKQNTQGSVYASANLFSPQQIYKMLSEHGNTQLLTTGFIPEKDWLIKISSIGERLGQFIRPRRGAFIAARVDL